MWTSVSPWLVALLKRYPPQLSGPTPPSVARRAADAVTNLAHENNNIKNHVRTEAGAYTRSFQLNLSSSVHRMTQINS